MAWGMALAALLLAFPAAAWFPPYDPAYLKSGAAPPVIRLAPLHAFGDSQNVDGHVFPMDEYASGAKVELSDGRPNWMSFTIARADGRFEGHIFMANSATRGGEK